MKILIKLFFIVIGSLCLPGCDKMEYSPHIKHDKDTPTNINKNNIEELQAKPNEDDAIRIVFTGDSQNYYDDAVPLVEKVNTIEGVDFLIHSGDIAEYSLLTEFEWMHGIFSKLKVPYITVIGNHDVLANGEDIFRRMYGNLNFSFVYDSVKFILHNTNSREYSFNGKVPDLNYLKSECVEEPGVKNFIAVSHVPPFDNDFDKTLEDEYASVFANCKGFLLSLHGHTHNIDDKIPYNDGVRYINSNSVNKKSFLLLDIYQGKVSKKIISY